MQRIGAGLDPGGGGGLGGPQKTMKRGKNIACMCTNMPPPPPFQNPISAPEEEVWTWQCIFENLP